VTAATSFSAPIPLLWAARIRFVGAAIGYSEADANKLMSQAEPSTNSQVD
jgi:hypothetical protein